MTITPQELTICREIHAGLTSRERSNFNYIFLEPVDASYFPTYLSTVKRPMDLRTLKEHLENGIYANKEEFYADAKLIFDNAVLFNKDRSESSWVVDLAKRMAKAFDRVRKNAEKKAARLAAAAAAADGGGDGDQKPSKVGEKKKGGGDQKASKEGKKKKITLKLKRTKPKTEGVLEEDAPNSSHAQEIAALPKLKRQKSTSSMGENSKASSIDSVCTGEITSTNDSKPAKKSKMKLKLKLPTGSDAASIDSVCTGEITSTNDSKPAKKSKMKLKLKLPTGSDAASIDSVCTGEITSTNDSKPAKKSKMKLKLKLSTGSDAQKGDANKAKVKSSVSSKPDSAAGISEEVQVPMNSFRRAQCYKIISSLKRRQPAACKWFHKPVTDPAIIKDYKEKIKNPTDLGTISSKLDKNEYSNLGDFVLDLRRIAANCLQYNTTVDDSFRPLAIDFLTTAEDLCKLFIAKHESPNHVYPSILYCWADCVNAMDELIGMTNPEDKLQTAWYFLHPVSYFCGGSFPEGYLDKVPKPIDLGTICQHLITGRYRSVGAFVADCRSVVGNCNAFYAGNDEGTELCEKANRLYGSMENNLGQLFIFDQSDKGAKAREKATSKYMVIKRPEKDYLRDLMRELRAATYTDKSAKITEKATLHFEKPVDTTIFTDYPQFVETPMDLETVDRKIESGSYETPEDFEYDVALIFKNCEWYNGPKKNFHMINLGKHTAKIFRKLFAEKMRGGSVGKRPALPTSANRVPAASIGGKGAGKVASAGKVGGKKRPASPAPEERPSKRVSIKGPSRTASKSVSSSSSGKPAPKSKVVKKLAKSPTPKIALTNPSAPVPMHVAIASIKESYPGRRQNKDLEGWEAECLKFMRQLMKHPWVSAERPKYIFHVPVPILFPEIRDSYAAKIEHPMDLTTAEAKLLQGVYPNAEEFISDIALVFSNAIAFNKEGHDVGDPMSCAYYEASTHLLKYIRWLSLEVIQSCLVDCSDSPVVESGSASDWKLTIRNRQMARKEMESIVFNDLLDKTEPGDKLSWGEQECEKLLKSLRHMSDYKRMGYFVQMNFPLDYTVFISKPIAWDKCQEKLKERQYNTIGETVADLRLIFTNALKYNEGARHQNKVSELAYDSAIHMSGKLEAAIDKMLLNVGDRLGRERIDMITSTREMEATERAEEEQRKQQWEKENPGSTVEVKTKLKIIHQRNSHRKKMTDFEFPFYDEEDDQVESHADSLQHAKALYEKQREARATMQDIALSVGIHVFRRHQERAAAKAWGYQMAYKAHTERIRIEKDKAAAKKEENSEEVPAKQNGACVLSALNDSSRKQIKMSIQKPKKLKRKLLFL